MNNKNIYFHVGLAKSGSTFLQKNFFPKLQNIKYISTHKYRRCIKIIKNTNSPLWKEIYSSKIVATIDSTAGFDSISVKKKTFIMMMSFLLLNWKKLFH